MFSTWNKVTLTNFSAQQWFQTSYFSRWVGLLKTWHDGSFLLQWDLAIGAILISLILTVSPFVSTGLIGLLLFAASGYLFLVIIADNNKFLATPIHLLLLLYWGISVIATAFSPVKTEALSGLIKLTLYLLLFALFSLVFQSEKLKNWIITVFLHVSLLVSGYGVRQQFVGVKQLATWNDPTSLLANETRVYSYLGNPNLLAAYLLPAIALSLAAIFIWRGYLPKALAITMVIVNTACLFFTDSRGGWLGMVGIIGVLLLGLRYWYNEYLPSFWQKWLLPIVLGSLGIVLVIGLIFVEPLRLRILSIFAGRQDSSNNFRINVWSSVIEMIKDRPIIGIGPGNKAFNTIYPLYMKQNYTALSAYSIYLETAVETGLIGLSCFLWIILVTINQVFIKLKSAFESKDKQGLWLMAALAAIAGLMIHGFFDTVWYRPQVNSLWWFMLALIASQPNSSQKQEVESNK
jgi:putative inorganic carbon (hco3(-)) transporter